MRRLGRHLAAGLLAAVVATPLVHEAPDAYAEPTPTTESPAGPTTAPPQTLPMLIRLSDLRPPAPQPGQVVSVTGRLTNTSGETVSDLRVRLRLGAAIGNRSALADYAAGGDTSFGQPLRGTEHPLRVDRLLPGASAPFLLTLDTRVYAELLPGAGVYQLGLEARGSTSAGFGPVARLRTFLPWAPTTEVTHPTRVAWLWPLADRPHRATTVFRDDDLARSLSAEGRLGGLLAAGSAAATPPPPATPPRRGGGARTAPPTTRAVPVTWAVDPMLVDDVAAMADGYRVQQPDGPRRPGSGQAVAQAWLSDLRNTLRPAETLALPYADPDAVAIVSAGLGHDLAVAAAAGRQDLEQRIGVPRVTDAAWPPGGFADSETLSTLFAANLGSVVLSDRAVPLTSDPTYTPTAHTRLSLPDGTLDAALTDTTLHDVVQSGAADPRVGPLSVQRYLAETLLITLERPGTPRDVVVAPDRRWGPAPSYAAALLSDTGQVPWIEPVRLTDVLTGPVSDLERAPLTYPLQARRQQLPRSYLRVVAQMRADVRGLLSLLTDPDAPLPHQLSFGILHSESSAWRDDLAGGVALRDDVRQSIADARGKVRIVSSGLVTLTSRAGTVPITIANDLAQPARVVLHLDAGSRARIEGSGTVTETLPARRQVQLEVRTKAQTAGVFQLRVWLAAARTPDVRYGPRVTLYVRSTAYGTVALGITGGALAVLFAAVIVRLTRRAMRARAARGPTT